MHDAEPSEPILFGDNDAGLLRVGETSHRRSRKPEWRPKTSLIQTKHRLEIIRPIPTKLHLSPNGKGRRQAPFHLSKRTYTATVKLSSLRVTAR